MFDAIDSPVCGGVAITSNTFEMYDNIPPVDCDKARPIVQLRMNRTPYFKLTLIAWFMQKSIT